MAEKPCFAPTFGASGSLACAFLAILLSVYLAILIVVLILTFGNEAVLCMIRQIMFRIQRCGHGNSDREIDLSFDLETFLADRPELAGAMRWENTDGTVVAYPDWSAGQKDALAKARRKLEIEGTLGLPAEPQIELELSGSLVLATELEPALAWSYYAGFVAQSLVVEHRQRVNWSLSDLNDEQRGFILDSRSLFSWRPERGRYGIMQPIAAPFEHGRSTPGDPGRIFDFLDSGALIAATRLGTIEHVLEWCRTNLVHYLGSATPDNLAAHWGFPGWPPVESVLAGTQHTDPIYPPDRHWTAGCWGTTAFLRMVFRAVNIPVQHIRPCGHASPVFLSEGLFLTHGDDLYNARSKWEPAMPIGDLLLPVAKIAEWLNPSAQCHVGRGVPEMLKLHLPFPLLKAHCRDRVNGFAHGDGEVFEIFAPYQSVAELEAEGLWSAIEARITQLGGCDAIPD